MKALQQETCPSQINGRLSTLAAVMQAAVSDHGDEERTELYGKAQSSLQPLLYRNNVDIGRIRKALFYIH